MDLKSVLSTCFFIHHTIPSSFHHVRQLYLVHPPWSFWLYMLICKYTTVFVHGCVCVCEFGWESTQKALWSSSFTPYSSSCVSSLFEDHVSMIIKDTLIPLQTYRMNMDMVWHHSPYQKPSSFMNIRRWGEAWQARRSLTISVGGEFPYPWATWTFCFFIHKACSTLHFWHHLTVYVLSILIHPCRFPLNLLCLFLPYHLLHGNLHSSSLSLTLPSRDRADFKAVMTVLAAGGLHGWLSPRTTHCLDFTRLPFPENTMFLFLPRIRLCPWIHYVISCYFDKVRSLPHLKREEEKSVMLLVCFRGCVTFTLCRVWAPRSLLMLL